MSRIGKLPVPVPKNVTATLDGQTIKVKGPTRRARAPAASLDRASSWRTASCSSRARPTQRAQGAARTHAFADREHGRRRDEGLPEEARDHRRRLQGREAARTGCSSRSASRTRSNTRRRRGSSSPRRSRRRSSSRARTRRWSARSPPSFAACVRPSRTRARASSTPAKYSPQGRQGGRQVNESDSQAEDARRAALSPPSARSQEGEGTAERPRLVVFRRSSTSTRSSSTTWRAARC